MTDRTTRSSDHHRLRRGGRPAGPDRTTSGPGDPEVEFPTATHDAVTDRLGGAHDNPSGPPARPRFEFRPPPSAVEVPRPPVLTLSSVLWTAAAVALLVGVLLPVLGVGDLWADVAAVVQRDFPNESPATRDRAVAVVSAALVGSGVLLALMTGGAAAALRSGRRGARVLLALLLPVVAVHALLVLSVAPVLSAVLLGVGVALGLVAGVLMFLPDATKWLVQPRRPGS